ncbi:MAG: carboxypeptidase-like regulatory domain-containing protein [Thermoguttaceae bacterium]|jgi:hypothetical protein
MNRILIPSVFLFLISFAAAEAMATAQEEFGNTANDVHRVYAFWCMSSTQFYYRGDTAALNNALRNFAAMKAEAHEVVLRPGQGVVKSLGGKEVQFNWNLIRGSIPGDQIIGGSGPMVLTAYVGGDIPFAKIEIPKGVKVLDERLEAHGFTPADGHVLEGKVYDAATRRPVAARVRLEGVAETVADPQGRWVLKKAPAGTFRVVVEADGYVPRVVGHALLDGQPRWQSFDGGLSRPAPVSGSITDDAGKPLPGAKLELNEVVSGAEGCYVSPQGYACQSDADGRFRLDMVPAGSARIWLRESGYCLVPRGCQPITMPAKEVALQVTKPGRVHVTVDFAGKNRPASYSVYMEPEGGNAIGTYGGGGEFDTKKPIIFEGVRPGRYVLHGHTIEVKSGQTTEVKLSAK